MVLYIQIYFNIKFTIIFHLWKTIMFSEIYTLSCFYCISSDLEYSYASKLYGLMNDIWMCIQMETMKCHWKQSVEPRSAISGTHINIDKKVWLPIFSQTVNELDLHFQGQTFRISLVCYCSKMAWPRNIILLANVFKGCYLIDFQQNCNCPWPNPITSLSNLSSETYKRMPTAILVRGHTMDKI